MELRTRSTRTFPRSTSSASLCSSTAAASAIQQAFRSRSVPVVDPLGHLRSRCWTPCSSYRPIRSSATSPYSAWARSAAWRWTKSRLALCQALRHRHRAAPAILPRSGEDRRGVRQRQRRRAGVHQNIAIFLTQYFKHHIGSWRRPGISGAPAHRPRTS